MCIMENLGSVNISPEGYTKRNVHFFAIVIANTNNSIIFEMGIHCVIFHGTNDMCDLVVLK